MKLYVVEDSPLNMGSASTTWLLATETRLGNAPTCPLCGRYVGLLPPMPPIRVELEAHGREWGDVAFGSGVDLLVSERFRSTMLDKGIVGLSFQKADAVDVRASEELAAEAPNYYLASITRSRAAIDDFASGLLRDRIETRCPECRQAGPIRRFTRITIEPGSWSGEDIFTARGLPGTRIATERFKLTCTEGRLSNIGFVPAEEYGTDYGVRDIVN